MPIEIDLSQAERGLVRVSDFSELAREPIRSVLREEVQALAADIRGSIRPGGGRPSLPGAPPHSQSGNLESSFRTTLPRGRKNIERAAFVSSWPRGAHAHLLESGTRRMLPRPFAVPAAQRRYGDFVQKIEAAIERAAQATNAG